jgi:cyclase
VSLSRRVVVCLDVANGRVVKGTNFVALRDVGDPTELAARYERDGADEIVFLDIAATHEQRATMLSLVQRTAERLFVPLTVGGGIDSADAVGRALRAGADKVAINSAAVRNPALLTAAAERFGAQCVVASIDAARTESGWRVFVNGGRVPTDRDAVEWANECVARGAGEILLTSIDRDGARTGYDLELTRAVSCAVSVPVIASGGAGRPSDVLDAFVEGRADAALVAGVLHSGQFAVRDFKIAMRAIGLATRKDAA